MNRATVGWALFAAACLILGGVPSADGHSAPAYPQDPALSSPHPIHAVAPSNDSAVGNFSAALQRLVTLLGVGGGALLALVWARVGLSWFSNDVTKKIQAKDRARDALVGTLVFTAALSGLVWGLARWVITGG